VADGVVKLPEHIKHVGTHDVQLRFTEDVTASVRVVVVPEQAEGAEAAEEGAADDEKTEAEEQ